MGFCQAVSVTRAFDGTSSAASTRSTLWVGALIKAAAVTAATVPAVNGARSV